MNTIVKVRESLSDHVNNSLYLKMMTKLTDIVHSFTSVRRFSNKTLIKDENIAEHSSNVAIICTALYDMMTEDEKKSISIDRLIAHCVFHDFDEIFTGDMITPVKYSNPQVKQYIDDYAEDAISKFCEMTGFSTIGQYAKMDRLNDLEKCILKISDILSVFIKIHIEQKLGNQMLNIDLVNIDNALSNVISRDFIQSPRLLVLLNDVIIYIRNRDQDIDRIQFDNMFSFVYKK